MDLRRHVRALLPHRLYLPIQISLTSMKPALTLLSIWPLAADWPQFRICEDTGTAILAKK
jgi:hypothetical protein